MIKCTTCNEVKTQSEFYLKKDRPNRKLKCKRCKRKDQIVRKYKLTLDQAEKVLNTHSCSICLKPIGGYNQCVDHDHKTSKVRGILCVKCNFGIGYFDDSEEKLQRAIDYIKYNKYELE